MNSQEQPSIYARLVQLERRVAKNETDIHQRIWMTQRLGVLLGAILIGIEIWMDFR